MGEGAPESHNGRHDFTFRVAFSEDVVAGDGVAPAERTFRDHSLEVTNGSVTNARRVNGQRDLWEVTVKPNAEADVTVNLPGNRRCREFGAICTSGGWRLSDSSALTVPYVFRTPLTAEFQNVPDSHNGGDAFTFRIAFSEDITTRYAIFRNLSLEVTYGQVTKARRVNGQRDLWEVTVKPDFDAFDLGFYDDVTVVPARRPALRRAGGYLYERRRAAV